MVLRDVALLAGEIGAGGCHMDIKISVRCRGVGQGHVPALVIVSPATLGMTLNAVGALRQMHGLNGLIHGNGHVRRIRNKQAIGLYPFIILLVAHEAIDVLKLGRCCRRLRLSPESDMTGAAGIPVPQNGNTVTVQCRVEFPLHIRAVNGVKSLPLPLVMTGAVHFERFGFMTGQAGLRSLPRLPIVRGYSARLTGK